MTNNKSKIFMVIARDAQKRIISSFGIADSEVSLQEALAAAKSRLGESQETVRVEIHVSESNASYDAGKLLTALTSDDMPDGAGS